MGVAGSGDSLEKQLECICCRPQGRGKNYDVDEMVCEDPSVIDQPHSSLKMAPGMPIVEPDITRELWVEASN